jgi:hypothetical protein
MNTTKLLPVLLLTLCWSFTAISQLQNPKWEMPFYFEDGNGERDTILIGCDPKGTFSFDTLFEKKKVLDTTKFEVYAHQVIGNFAKTKDVVYANPEGFRSKISFNNGVYPLKMKWDRSYLADTSLPFFNKTTEDSNGKIYIQAGFSGAGPHIPCPITGFYSIITRSPYPEHQLECLVIGDSLVFDDGSMQPDIPISLEIPLEFIPHDFSYYTGIEEKGELAIEFFPNPVRNNLTVKNLQKSDLHIYLYNHISQPIIKRTLNKQEKLLINLSNIRNGMYTLVWITSNGESHSKKLIKQ